MHTLLPRLFLAHRKLELAEKELLVIRLQNRLAYAYWFKRGPVPCLWSHLRGMNLAEEAEVIFATGYRNAEQAGVTNSWVYPLRCWLASAMRRQAEKSSHWSPNHRAAVLKRASKVASKALGVARKFQNDLPHALRETGLIAAMQGSVRQAKKHLDESLAVAELQGAR